MKSMWIFRRPVFVILDICIMACSKPCLIQEKHNFSFLFFLSSNPFTLIFSLLCMYLFYITVDAQLFYKTFSSSLPVTHTIKSITTKSTLFSQPNTLHHYTKDMCTLLFICCSWTQTSALTVQCLCSLKV
jgi:hypothetical protein